MFYLQQRIFQEIHFCHLDIVTASLPSGGQSVMFGEDEAVRQWRSLVSHSHLHTVELARTAPGGETLHVDSHQLVLDWPGGAWLTCLSWVVMTALVITKSWNNSKLISLSFNPVSASIRHSPTFSCFGSPGLLGSWNVEILKRKKHHLRLQTYKHPTTVKL